MSFCILYNIVSEKIIVNNISLLCGDECLHVAI